jgi:hypothetical protein
MNRINLAGNTAEARNSFAWRNRAGALLFAAILIVCSVAVGCSSEKPQPVSSNNPIAQAPVPSTVATMAPPVLAAEATKPAPKKIAKKRPATVTYTDRTYGVSFAYPRRYALETGNAATELISGGPVPMNFVQAGGVALAAVELPETSFPGTDLSSAFFNVSVHKDLTAELCQEFSVPQSTAPGSADSSAKGDASQSASKLMLGDMEMQGTEAVTGEGTRQSDAKYFHIFQNGACYEFALNVTTIAPVVQANVQGGKHVDREKVFNRLEQILATVKINPVEATPVAAPETSASTAATPSAPAPTPAAEATASTPATPAPQAAPATPVATGTSPQ